MVENSENLLERQSIAADMVILREGETGNTAYLIQSGRVSVTVSKEGKDVELAQMGAGEIFGEMALVSDAPRSATVKALIDTSVILITRNLIDKKLAKSDPTIRALLPMLMKRLEQTNNALLDKDDGVASLVKTSKATYHNIERSLSPNKRKTLENSVKPKLDALITSVIEFKEKYKD